MSHFSCCDRHHYGTSGTVIRANAFKCGDDCAEPHFGTLFPIDPKKVPEPAFHVPQYFGEWRLL